jgi:sugar lactone lactonase YvrE
LGQGTTMGTLVTATPESYVRAEGSIWDAPRRRLPGVDIVAGAVLEGTLNGAGIDVTGRHDFDHMVGALTAADDGTILVAGQERLVVGSMSCGDSSDREVLVRLGTDGSLPTVDDDLELSNSLAWSTDGTQMFSVDTGRATVFVRDYDVATGAGGVRRVRLRLTDGSPDGLAVDEADHLWMAVWGAGEVRRFAPDGTLVETIAVHEPHTSSVAFAGDDLRSLVVTTAQDGLGEEQLRGSPLSGYLFSTRVEVPGTPVAPWSGWAAPAIDAP